MIPSLQDIQNTIAMVRRTLDKIRSRFDKLQAELAALRDPGNKYQSGWLEAERARRREAAHVEVTAIEAQADALAACDRWLALAPQWSLTNFIRRARFADSLAAAVAVSTGERLIGDALRGIFEESTRLRWMFQLRDASEEDLQSFWSDALSSKHLALIGLLSSEVGRRVRCCGTDDAGAGLRALQVSMLRDLEELELPELVQGRQALDDLRQLKIYLESAVRSVLIGDDPGRRLEQIHDLRRRGVEPASGMWTTIRDKDGNPIPAPSGALLGSPDMPAAA